MENAKEVKGIEIDVYRRALCAMIAEGKKFYISKKDENSKELWKIFEDRDFVDLYLSIYGNKDKCIRRLLRQAIRLEIQLPLTAYETHELCYRVEGNSDLPYNYIDVCVDADREWWSDPELHEQVFTEEMIDRYRSNMVSTGGNHSCWGSDRHMYAEYLFKHFVYYPEALGEFGDADILIIANHFIHLLKKFGGDMCTAIIARDRSWIVTRLIDMQLVGGAAMAGSITLAKWILEAFSAYAPDIFAKVICELPEIERNQWTICMVTPLNKLTDDRRKAEMNISERREERDSDL